MLIKLHHSAGEFLWFKSIKEAPVKGLRFKHENSEM